ncbi:hypothetical protein CKM354_000934700 [Cercospora kikuchii]|uniref:Uncharacterized protein n=1 Tax=Cercospora kikuchii TaxID=84275 RepID=A0A9P3CN15_9PEZI|nr:uncharacterized protein CKM354_000934700 [Cercospora kikuchii]GIZ46212.1 hypothetical protein CKM354_000934700 [Cercospora kikuchii]
MAATSSSAVRAQCIVIDDEKQTTTINCEVCDGHFNCGGLDARELYYVMSQCDSNLGVRRIFIKDITWKLALKRDEFKKTIEKCGDLFLHNWLQADRAQKKKWLKTAMPFMPADWSFLGDIEDHRESRQMTKGQTSGDDDKMKLPLRLPYMNQATLTRHQMVVPHLIISRCYVQELCVDWLRFDLQQMCSSWHMDKRLLSLRGAGIPSKGISTIPGPEFGKFHFDPAKLHSLEHIGSGRAYVAMEAQLELLDGLQAIMQEVSRFHDKSCKGGGNGLRHAAGNVINQGPSIAVLYPSPQPFQITEVAERMRAQRQTELDNLLFLQSDPDYLRHFVSNLEMGNEWQFIATPLWNRNNYPGQGRSCTRARYGGYGSYLHQRALISVTVRSSRGFQDAYDEQGNIIKGKLSSRALFTKDTLLWTIDRLAREPLFSLRSGALQQRFDLLQQTLDSATEPDERMTDILLHQLALLALYDEILQAVTLLDKVYVRIDNGWPAADDFDLAVSVPKGKWSKSSKSAGQALREFANAKQPEGTKGDLARFDKIELKRKELWKNVQVSWGSRPGLEEQARLLLSDYDSIETQQIIQEQREPFQQASDLKYWGDRDEDSPLPAVSKKQQKRAARDTSPPPPQPAPAVQQQNVPPPPPPVKITVSRDAYISFEAIFPPPGKAPAKKMRWIEFQQAMAAAGFAMRDAMGSARVFTTTRYTGERARMIFHMPHSRMIDHQILRIFSRRLNRQYGWDSDTFQSRD